MSGTGVPDLLSFIARPADRAAGRRVQSRYGPHENRLQRIGNVLAPVTGRIVHAHTGDHPRAHTRDRASVSDDQSGLIYPKTPWEK